MPAKRSTRRAISLKGTTYARLKRYCARHEQTGSGLLERLVTDYLDAAGEPPWEGPAPERGRAQPPPTPPEEEVEEIASQHFTF